MRGACSSRLTFLNQNLITEQNNHRPWSTHRQTILRCQCKTKVETISLVTGLMFVSSLPKYAVGNISVTATCRDSCVLPLRLWPSGRQNVCQTAQLDCASGFNFRTEHLSRINPNFLHYNLIFISLPYFITSVCSYQMNQYQSLFTAHRTLCLTSV
jgi:hypothetical protein